MQEAGYQDMCGAQTVDKTTGLMDRMIEGSILQKNVLQRESDPIELPKKRKEQQPFPFPIYNHRIVTSMINNKAQHACT